MTTPRFDLPYLATGQAQKEVTYNETLNRIDTVLQPFILNATTTTPPPSPEIGQVWIVATGASGAWAGRENDLAAWFGGWQFFAPQEGWSVWDAAQGLRLSFDGTEWFEESIGAAITAADEAKAAAAIAAGISGPRYATVAAGLAATANGDEFAVDNFDGTATVYLNDNGTAAQPRTLILDPANSGTAGQIGVAGWESVQAALDDLNTRLAAVE